MDDKLIIRTSDRLSFKRCRQAWDFGSKIRQNYEPEMTALPLEFGTDIHEAMEVLYEPSTWRMDREVVQLAALETFRQSRDRRYQAYLATLPEGVFEPDPVIKAQRFDEPYELGVGMLEHYFKWSPPHDNFTPVKVEIEFEVPIPWKEEWGDLPPDFLHDGKYLLMYPGIPIYYQGRVDVLVLDQFGRYWIVDHKTAGQFGATDYLEMDEQCGSYIWALQKMLSLPIAGVLYNRMLKAVPKPPEQLKNGGFSVNKQQRTTYEVYKQTLIDHGISPSAYIDFLEFLQDKGNTFFQRIQVMRSQREIDNLERQIAIEAIDMLNDPSIYPNVGMFNCMGCNYRKPCLAKMDGSDVQWILNSQYKLREGEPVDVNVD